jgi:hypothetical protein
MTMIFGVVACSDEGYILRLKVERLIDFSKSFRQLGVLFAFCNIILVF